MTALDAAVDLERLATGHEARGSREYAAALRRAASAVLAGELATSAAAAIVARG